MKIFFSVFSILLIIGFSSCGAENDAKDVCNCYKEVIELQGDEADEKMEECMDMLAKYLQEHDEAGTLEEFNEAYNKCR